MRFDVIASKSIAHRGYICQFLAGGNIEEIRVNKYSEDILATKNGILSLQNYIKYINNEKDYLEKEKYLIIDVKDSASTFRFLLVIAGFLGIDCIFILSDRLYKRPNYKLFRELERLGCHIEEKSYEAIKSLIDNNKYTDNNKHENGSNTFDELMNKDKNKGKEEDNKHHFIMISGKIKKADFDFDGNLSSQYITGALLGIPILGSGRVAIYGKLQSKSYVDITIEVIKKFGVQVLQYEIENSKGKSKGKDNRNYYIEERQKYKPLESFNVEGDWSNGANIIAAVILYQRLQKLKVDCIHQRDNKKIANNTGHINNNNHISSSNVNSKDLNNSKINELRDKNIEICNLNIKSVQGDKEIIEILEKFNVKFRYEDDEKLPQYKKILPYIDEESFDIEGEKIIIDGNNIPDIVPIIALMGTLLNGTLVIENIGRLRYKESDRIEAIIYVLDKLGAKYGLIIDDRTKKESLEVTGTFFEKIYQNKIVFDGYKDHRIIMLETLSSFITGRETEILGYKYIEKSYPSFFEELDSLGIIEVKYLEDKISIKPKL